MLAPEEHFPGEGVMRFLLTHGIPATGSASGGGWAAGISRAKICHRGDLDEPIHPPGAGYFGRGPVVSIHLLISLLCPPAACSAAFRSSLKKFTWEQP